MNQKTFSLILFFLFDSLILSVKAQEHDISALANYNFSGNGASFNTVGTEVYYGFRELFGFKGTNSQNSYYEISPSIATPISLAEKKNYIPGLMLPGAFNIAVNMVFKVNSFLSLSPLNFGFKVLTGYSDSAKTIFQHNIRSGFAIQRKDLFALQFQYTWSWHNSTSDSQDAFNYVFSKQRSNVEYFTATLQTKVSANDAKIPTYLIVQFRDLVNNGSALPGLKNYRIISMGIRASVIDLNVGSQAISKDENKRQRKLVQFRN